MRTDPNKQSVIVTIAPDGTIQTEVQGVKGASCMDVTKQLNAALGTVAEDTKTSEYSQRPIEEKDNVRLGYNRR